jgi:hypothetical protein
MTEESRIRGRQVHLACQWADQHAPTATTVDGVLDVLDIAEPIWPYLAGWLLFKKEYGFISEWWERPLYLPSPLIAGTPDTYGRLRGGRRAIVDLKSWASCGPKPKRSAVIQTAGYKLMVEDRLEQAVDVRIIVKLSGDNKYRAYECTDHEYDEHVFRCAAFLYWDRLNNQLADGTDRSEVEVAA